MRCIGRMILAYVMVDRVGNLRHRCNRIVPSGKHGVARLQILTSI